MSPYLLRKREVHRFEERLEDIEICIADECLGLLVFLNSTIHSSELGRSLRLTQWGIRRWQHVHMLLALLVSLMVGGWWWWWCCCWVFEQLAKRYHPDVNKGNPEAEKSFRMCNKLMRWERKELSLNSQWCNCCIRFHPLKNTYMV
jgi:hypothetical protein